MFCMVLFRNEFLIALSYIILFQFVGIGAIIVSDLISGSVSAVNNNRFSKITKIVLLNIFFLQEYGG